MKARSEYIAQLHICTATIRCTYNWYTMKKKTFFLFSEQFEVLQNSKFDFQQSPHYC